MLVLGGSIVDQGEPSTLSNDGFDTTRSLLHSAANSSLYIATKPTWWRAHSWNPKPLLKYETDNGDRGREEFWGVFISRTMS